MAENSGIEWTDHTFNPWQGCVKVSPACTNCYAATLGARFGVEWGPKARRKFQTESYWQQPLKWNAKAEKAGKRARVFCASMADVFEKLPREHPDEMDIIAARAQLWDLIEATPALDWLLLTKRPEWILHMVPRPWKDGFPTNVWVGTTLENQDQDLRLHHLAEVPSSIHFVSVEPMLGPITLSGEKEGKVYHWLDPHPRAIHWVICGGESGPGARPLHPDWVRSLRDQCQTAGVPFFFKQWGERAPTNGDARNAWGTPYCGNDDPDGKAVFALPDGALTDTAWNGGPGPHLRGGTQLIWLGKKAAGRLLDGREWNEVPA